MSLNVKEAFVREAEAVRHQIRELCQERNIACNKLAIMSGVTQPILQNILIGRNNSATVSTVKNCATD